MAGKSNTSATFFAQKKLLGKAHTSNLKTDGEELIGSNIQAASSLIFGQAIPTSASLDLYTIQSASLGAPGTIEYIPFILTELTGTRYDANNTNPDGGAGQDSGEDSQGSGPHTYKFVLPSDYTSNSSNTKSGNGFFNNNKIVHETLGKIQLVPPFFSQEAPNPYIVKIYKDDGGGGVGDEIPLLDNVDWNVDYYNGILFLQDYKADKIPAHARAFAYVGDMLDVVVTSSAGSGGGGGGGDAGAQYLVLSATGSLSNERVFNPGTGLLTTDGGSGGNYTVSVNDSVFATLSGSIFGGSLVAQDMSGSLTQLSDGTSYLVAGNNITITSASSGQVTISTSASSFTRQKNIKDITADTPFNTEISVPGMDLTFTNLDDNYVDVLLNGQYVISGSEYNFSGSFNSIRFSYDLQKDDRLVIIGYN